MRVEQSQFEQFTPTRIFDSILRYGTVLVEKGEKFHFDFWKFWVKMVERKQWYFMKILSNVINQFKKLNILFVTLKERIYFFVKIVGHY